MRRGREGRLISWCSLLVIVWLWSAPGIANDDGMDDLKNLAQEQACSDVMSAISDRDTIARVIVIAGLMTDNQAIGELLGQGEEELALFVEDVFHFCKVIPAYSFKQITDRVL